MKKFSNFLFSRLPRTIKKEVSQTVMFLIHELSSFFGFLRSYLKDKIVIFSAGFERNKNIVVKNVLIKRGKRNRMFLHASALAVLTLGIFVSPFLSENSLFSNEQQNVLSATASASAEPLAPDDVFHTQISDKPRDKVIVYRVEKGDTLSTIAKKFGVSEETIKWANDLKSDSITVGDDLNILPVTGIAHKVARGDTVHSVAKKYDVNAQEIVDFPFNDFANPQTFSLVEGQTLIVPNGIKPAEQQKGVVRQRYIATGPVKVSGTGFTWPVQGSINQYYSWYHRALDIGASVGTPVLSAQSGTVAEVYNAGWNGGYGTHVIISGSNGYQTLYAHMSATNVSPGDPVVAGSTVVGWVGLTGRTTGAHLHFEIRGSGGLSDPLGFLGR